MTGNTGLAGREGGGANGEQRRKDVQGRGEGTDRAGLARSGRAGGMNDGWRVSLLLAAESRERRMSWEVMGTQKVAEVWPPSAL